MKALVCEMCGAKDIVKQDGYFVCQFCGMKYSPEEAKKMMIEGTVDVQGTVKVDNSAFVEKYLANARRAYEKEDWEEVEKYYNMVEQNAPNNMEAVFFSAYGKAMLSLTDSDYYKRQHKFSVLKKSISVINDYYELTSEDKEAVLNNIAEAIIKMHKCLFVYDKTKFGTTFENFSIGGKSWQKDLMDNTRRAFLTELRQISEKHDEIYIKNLIKKMSNSMTGGCYVATAVYGSYNCPEVWTLRRYRDYTLAESWYGRAFIKTYYAISPTIVKYFGHTEWFKKMWKGKLDRMVKDLNESGVENTPYNDRQW